jgi:hypothetical protein
MPGWQYGTGAGNSINGQGGGYTPPKPGVGLVNGPQAVPPNQGLNYGVNYNPGLGPDGKPKQGNDPNAPNYDPHANDLIDDQTGATHPQIGGYIGGANDLSQQLSAKAAGAANRPGQVIDASQTGQDRGYGLDALAMQRDAAYGTGQSLAQQALMQGSQAAQNGQTAMAASARGGGGNIALAQRQAASGNLAMQSQAANQSQILRANEMAQARGDYANQAGAMQSADQLGAFQQAQLNAQQNAENDQTAYGYEGLANQNQLAQLQADTGAFTGQNTTFQQQQAINNDRQNRLISGTMGATTGALQAASQ